MDHKERNKQIKKVLEPVYGKGRVSVTSDTGNAPGWVQVRIEVDETSSAAPDPNGDVAADQNVIHDQALKLVLEAGIDLHYYTSDMDATVDHPCFHLELSRPHDRLWRKASKIAKKHGYVIGLGDGPRDAADYSYSLLPKNARSLYPSGDAVNRNCTLEWIIEHLQSGG